MRRVPRAFYDRDTVEVARALCGKLLARHVADGTTDGTTVYARIVETEAYHGPDDRASHAFRGRTPRAAIMFGPPGVAYVYQIYGMYFCLNVVTMAAEFPAAVLIRAACVPGDDVRAGAGPGKLCRALGIDKQLNGLDLVHGRELWIAEDDSAPPRTRRGPRIGIDYAGACARRPWRFWIADHPTVSKLPKAGKA